MMERDFLGLNSNLKEPLSAVKREITQEESQWSFKKASSFSRFMSLRRGAGQDGGINKMKFSLPANNQYVKPDFSSSGHNVDKPITRQQFQGVPMTITSPAGPVIGFTEPWNNSKPVTAPAQMTIFYGGTVSVYDGISPEKAQAIMLLAGNGSFITSNTSPPIHTKVQLPHMNANPHSSKDEQVMTNTKMISSAPFDIPEHQRVAASGGHISMPSMVPSALPQFRKASLARFLEKRKERVMSIGPYTCEKKQEANFPSNNVGSAVPLAM